MKIKSCNAYELERAIKEGKKIVVYGDTVIYKPNEGLDPHAWYRKHVANADIPVFVGILEEEYP